MVHAALLAWAATRHSPAVDEVGHMAAGVAHWKLRKFDLYRVNPPLVRLVATLPVVALSPETNWQSYSVGPRLRPEFQCGDAFISANEPRSMWLFAVARWACIPFSVLGGYVCYRWAGDLYGLRGGLLALALWCLCPNVLAHAQMITPDAGAAAIGVAACYQFWRWLREANWRRAIQAGAFLGVAELTKTTLLVLYVVWPLAWLVWRLSYSSSKDRCDRSEVSSRPGATQLLQLLFMFALSVYMINMCYAFEGSFKRLGSFEFVSNTLAPLRGEGDTLRSSNSFTTSWLAGLPVPFPESYILGIDQQKSDFELGLPSYLRGKWQHGGWWYYYLYGLAIKVPLGTWVLLLMAACAGCRSKGVPDISGSGMGTTLRDEVFLVAPAVTILALVSSQTGFGRHLRYVLPILPFVFIWAGRLGPRLGVSRLRSCFRARGSTVSVSSAFHECAGESRVSRVLSIIAGAALSWSVASSVWHYPHSMSYFNELVGGPLGGRWHMLDSNLDWGQDVLYLNAWLHEHPVARPLGFAYFGYFDPRAAGIAFSLPPRGPVESPTESGELDARRPVPPEELGPRPGWYAISVMMLHGFQYPIPDGQGARFYADEPYFTYFQRFEPTAMAGYSIYIYHLTPAAVDRTRRELGLPPLGDRAKSAELEDGRRS